ncbi:MAG: chemotaxis protein CheX [Pseudomonadota bacterium]
MIEKKLQVFIDGIVRYFEHTSQPTVNVGSPYLIRNIEDVSADYTGEIAISGAYEGACYFTAPSVLVRHLILSLGEQDTSEEMMKDTVGEVANTLSGNARKELGQEFIISVPRVHAGAPSAADMPSKDRMYAIPITWKSYKATLGIYLTQ